MGQFTREIGNGMMKQQAGAASEFIFTGYLKSWNSSSIYCSLLFLHLRNVMESAPHWDLGVLNSVHGSMPKESESKLGSQILGEYKWGDRSCLSPSNRTCSFFGLKGHLIPSSASSWRPNLSLNTFIGREFITPRVVHCFLGSCWLLEIFIISWSSPPGCPHTGAEWNSFTSICQRICV